MSWMYRVLILAAALSLAFATACMNPVAAPPGTVISEMEDIEIGWDPSWEGKESRWALVRADFMVYDDVDALPANNVVIEIGSSYGGVYVLPTGVINVEDCPADDNQWGTYCSDSNQTWAALTGDFNDALTPTYYKGYTNAQGVETVWLWVEDMPITEDSIGDVQIWATIGIDFVDFMIAGGS